MHTEEAVRPQRQFGASYVWSGLKRDKWGLTGRDLLAIVVEGTRTSYTIGLGATIVSVLIAIILGVSAGYLGGWWDGLISRLTDVTMGFPHLVFMIAVSALIPSNVPRVPVMIAIIGILGWTSTARVLRSHALSLRNRTFVQAARAMGASNWRILSREIMPNLVSTLIVPGNAGFQHVR